MTNRVAENIDPLDDLSTPYNVRTRESDGEDEIGDTGTTSFESLGDVNSQWNEEPQETGDDELQDGMLPRDVPKRTTFYDPVAERQMSQTDAKLFYQRSQAEARNGSGALSQATPYGSPMIASGSHPPTEYGADSLILDSEGPKSDAQTPWKSRPETPAQLSDYPATYDSPSKPKGHSVAQASRPGPSSVGRENNTFFEANASHVANVGLLGNSLFDTEPDITSELSAISKNIQRIRDLRRKYIALSNQGPNDNPRDGPDWEIYPPPPDPAWKEGRDGYTGPSGLGSGDGRFPYGAQPSPGTNETKRPTPKRKPGQDVGEDFNMEDILPLPGDDGMVFELDESGVYQVFESEKSKEPAIKVPTIRDFYMDLDYILTTSSDGPSKSFAFRRLQYLEGKFNLYVLLNEYQETADSKKVPHRDFYNVRKVDTHVHHSACMNQKHLLRFIKSKMKKFPNEVVLYRDGKHLTLAEVFASINLTAYDLSIDTLDMHVSFAFFTLAHQRGRLQVLNETGPHRFFPSI